MRKIIDRTLDFLWAIFGPISYLINQVFDKINGSNCLISYEDHTGIKSYNVFIKPIDNSKRAINSILKLSSEIGTAIDTFGRLKINELPISFDAAHYIVNQFYTECANANIKFNKFNLLTFEIEELASQFN